MRRPLRWKVGMSLGALLVYLSLFGPAYHHVMFRAATLLCLLPVLTVAFHFGPRWGALVGVAALPMNFSLLWLMGERWDSNIIPSNFWAAHALFVLFGWMVGQLCRLRAQLEDRLAEKEAAVAELRVALQEVRTLRGMLPICSGCKKIREGDEHWEHVEEYIRRRSHAEFTHSVCPECVKRLYPWMEME